MAELENTIPDTDPEQVSAEDRLADLMKAHGVATIEELDERIAAGTIRHRAFAKQRLENERLQQKLEEIEAKRDDAAAGISESTDPAVKSLARQVRQLQDTIAKNKLLDGDEDMEPLYEEVLERFPHVKRIANQEERVASARTLALGLKAEKEKSAINGRDASTQRTLARTHVERGGGSSPLISGRPSEAEDLARYKRDLNAAGSDKEARAKVDAKYRRQYPDWGI
jgi:hypothetical protein